MKTVRKRPNVNKDFRKCKKAEPEKYKEKIEEAFKYLETYHYDPKIEEEEKERKEREKRKLEEELEKAKNEKLILIDTKLITLLNPITKINQNEEVLSEIKENDCLDKFYEIDKELQYSLLQGVITLDELVDEGFAHYK